MKKSNKKIFLFLIVIAAFFYWIIEGGDLVPKNDTPQNDKKPSTVVENASFFEDKDGRRVWEITADIMQIDGATTFNTLKGVKGKFFQDDGAFIEIVSKEGTFNPANKEITLSGDVLATYSQGWKLKCQHFLWEPEKELLTASKEVEFTKDGLLVKGDKIESNKTMEKIKVTGNGFIQKGE